jgi:hypothetical protein
MDPIYSPITSHHTVADIEKVIDVCDFYLIVIPSLFISCWLIFILCNLVFGKRKKLVGLWLDSLPIGFIFAVIAFFYLSKTYSC